MESENQTHVPEFILLGLSEEEDLQPLLFGVFLSMYLVTFTGNLLIILAIITDSHLHTPMYFFLSNLSFSDICFTSATVPNMLLNIQIHNKVITYEGCITQIYFFVLFGALDTFLLTVMAYDRFVAICHPLHYTVIMNPKVCGLLLLVSWLLSCAASLSHTLMHNNCMEPENQTQVLEFILLGLSGEADLQPLLFGLFLSMYLVTFTGNLLIILAIITDSRLHTPMYFFLSNLSLADICLTSTTVPKMLVNIQIQNKVITYQSCIAQMYFFVIFGDLDSFLLTAMAYDRFVAICHPLRYTVIMSPKVCGLLLRVSWILMVSLYTGTVLGVYFIPSASQNSRASAIASVMYTVVTPMLNPFIYSLRNKDIKQALKRLFNQEKFFV
ncbi:PREDICTED: olfactory receptor 7A17-like [Elephantulus edwardii]|uniref:olfactory receptor 7A17-like n=1 Tax=Elephantulus edwardii TaxID=28737 RepID=UPI0003F0616E|nr:PREDICTED: olfactory receptor 7A17-like [Elephantulus edwardii]